ncbi:MAG: GNA1162 family protein [Myxococcota bacterium]
MRILFIVLLLGSSACATAQGYDYTNFEANRPQSILVLPPLNASPEVEAPGSWLSTVTRPLAERGYYVFPVHVVAAYMRDNGLPTAGEMHNVGLAKIDEVLGADAVLYTQIEEWGSSYFVVSTQVRVTLSYRLVHVKTGEILWEGTRSEVSSSDNGGGGGGAGLLGALIGAVVSQIANSLTDPSRPLAEQLNWSAFHDRRSGLLPGPYLPPAQSR